MTFLLTFTTLVDFTFLVVFVDVEKVLRNHVVVVTAAVSGVAKCYCD